MSWNISESSFNVKILRHITSSVTSSSTFSKSLPSFMVTGSLSLCLPGSSVDKESTCNAGDPGLIPGSGRSAGEGIGYPLQYSWTSLVAEMVKNPPVMWEIWVRSLGWEDTLEKGQATHSSSLAWRIHGQRSLAGYCPWGSQRIRHDWATFTLPFTKFLCLSMYSWMVSILTSLHQLLHLHSIQISLPALSVFICLIHFYLCWPVSYFAHSFL